MSCCTDLQIASRRMYGRRKAKRQDPSTKGHPNRLSTSRSTPTRRSPHSSTNTPPSRTTFPPPKKKNPPTSTETRYETQGRTAARRPSPPQHDLPTSGIVEPSYTNNPTPAPPRPPASHTHTTPHHTHPTTAPPTTAPPHQARPRMNAYLG
jgi:hypothetical protein